MSDRKPCKSCGAPIVWCLNHKGTKVPFDVRPTNQPHGAYTIERDEAGQLIAEPIADKGPEVSERPWFRSHFATCKDAKSWKGKKR